MRSCILVATFLMTTGFAAGQAASVNQPKKEDMPKYVSMLKSSPSPQDRAFAAEQLGRHGKVKVQDVKNAIEPLLSSMKSDQSAEVRRAAALALGDIGTQAKAVIPALKEALKDKSLAVNLAAVSALGQYGPQAKSVVPALRQFAKSKNKDKKIMRQVNLTIKQIVAPIQ
jgi:hypothetical protein